MKALAAVDVVAESIRGRFEGAKDSTSVCSCDASMRPGVKGTLTGCPASFAAFSMAASPPRTIRSASETFLPPDCEALNSFWIAFQFPQHLGQFSRLVGCPVFLGREANAGAVGPAALIGAAKVEAEAQAVETS